MVALLAGSAFPVFHDRYPRDYFRLPVNRPLQLSGTFGELRSNHFHAGLDIKSLDGSVGEPLYAAAPGYLARVKVEARGYGNAVYIEHPNGYTTVYAHLHAFTDPVAQYIKEHQYRQKRFEVDLRPAPRQYEFEQGELIGYLGNSGSSSGPHLHFEIRTTADQVPVNPLLFGLEVRDDVPPEIQRLKVYHYDAAGRQIHVNDHPVIRDGHGRYRLRDTMSAPAAQVAFAIQAFDQTTAVPNRNGIYALELTAGGERRFAFRLDRLPFSLTRYLNAHVDYAARVAREGFYHRCFRLPGNVLGIYEEVSGGGIITLNGDKVMEISITASDFHGNASTLTFPVKQYPEIRTLTIPDEARHIVWQQAASIQDEGVLISFDANTFYKDLYLTVVREPEVRNGYFAPVFQLNPADAAVHKYYFISMEHTGLPERIRSKAFLARINPGGGLVSNGGTMRGRFLTGEARALGTYTIAVDTIPPDIVPITFRPDMRGLAKMEFRITDNQATEGRARGLSYEATVNGEWILMEYDAKRHLLTHYFDERIGPGEHEIRLRVWDDRGNERVLARSFRR